MKKGILVFLAVFMLTSLAGQAQLLTKIKAKDGYTAGLEFAKTSKEMTNPKLQFIGTFNETMDYNGIQIPIEFDLTNGTATGWGYLFIDGDDTTKKSIVFVLKPIIGNPLTVEVPSDALGDMGFDMIGGAYLNDFEWMDSPAMLAKLKDNSDFSSFYNDYKPFDQVFAILSVLTNPITGAIEPLWAVSLSNSEVSGTCAVQAVNGEVFCTPIMTSIAENVISAFKVFPNPTSDYLRINSPDGLEMNSHAEIIDLFGRKIRVINLLQGDNQIDVSNLATGVYTIRVNNKISKFIKQ